MENQSIQYVISREHRSVIDGWNVGLKVAFAEWKTRIVAFQMTDLFID